MADVTTAGDNRTIVGRLAAMRISRRALGAAVVAAAVFKLAISEGGRHAPTLALVQVVLFTALAVLVLSGAARSIPLTRPMVGLLAAAALAAVGSVRPEASLRELLMWLLYLAIVVVTASTLADRASMRRFVDALVVIAGWLCLIALFMFWGADNPQMRWYSTFYWPNPFAAFLLLVYPLTVVRLAHAGAARDALVHGATALLLGVALALTYSRGAWLALVLVTPLGLVVLRPRSWPVAVFRTAVLAAATLLVAVVLTQGTAPRASPQGVVGRAASVSNLSDYAIRGRLHFWRAGLEIFADHPIAGTGPGTFGAVHALYQRDARYYAQDAHNLYVQTAAEMGLVGLAALALLLVAAARVWRRTLTAAWGRPEYPLLAGAGLGLAAFFLHSAVDMDWMFPANPAAAFAMIGILVYYDHTQPPPAPAMAPWKPSLRRVVAGGLVVAAAAAAASHLAHREFAAAQEQAREGQWSAAAAGYRRAVRWNPLHAGYLSVLATALAQTAPADLDAAAEALRRAMALDRMNAAIPLQLARVLLQEPGTGPAALAEAEALLRRSLALDPWNRPSSYRTLARLYLRQGRIADADRIYRDAIPRYVGRNLGTGSAIYLLLWPDVVGLLLDATEASVQSGDRVRAAQILEALLAEDPDVVPAVVRLSEIYAASDRRDDARTLLEAAAARLPDDPRIAAALERMR